MINEYDEQLVELHNALEQWQLERLPTVADGQSLKELVFLALAALEKAGMDAGGKCEVVELVNHHILGHRRRQS